METPAALKILRPWSAQSQRPARSGWSGCRRWPDDRDRNARSRRRPQPPCRSTPSARARSCSDRSRREGAAGAPSNHRNRRSVSARTGTDKSPAARRPSRPGDGQSEECADDFRLERETAGRTHTRSGRSTAGSQRRRPACFRTRCRSSAPRRSTWRRAAARPALTGSRRSRHTSTPRRCRPARRTSPTVRGC